MWTSADIQVTFRHTKIFCHDTVFLDEDDEGQPCVYRVVETSAAGNDNHVSYVPHFDFPDEDPPQCEWFVSIYEEVKA